MGRSGCASRIEWRESDTLSGEAYGWFNRGKPWWQWVEEENPARVVLGVGPHIAPAGPINLTLHTYSRLMDNVSKTVQRLKRARPGLWIAWKTVSGGGLCRKRPFEKQLPPFAAAEVPNHRVFPLMDELAVAAMKKAGVDAVLDLSPLYLRPDAHPGSQGAGGAPNPDCLHLCTPGPLDLIGPLMQRAMGQTAPGPPLGPIAKPNLGRRPSRLVHGGR